MLTVQSWIASVRKQRTYAAKVIALVSRERSFFKIFLYLNLLHDYVLYTFIL